MSSIKLIWDLKASNNYIKRLKRGAVNFVSPNNKKKNYEI